MTHVARSTCQASLGYQTPGAYRRTPAGQPSVTDLVRPGMAVRTSYHTGGIVVAVKGPFTDRIDGQDYETWSNNLKICAVNELIAVDGRTLALFENSDDELLIEDAYQRTPVDKHGQIGMLL